MASACIEFGLVGDLGGCASELGWKILGSTIFATTSALDWYKVVNLSMWFRSWQVIKTLRQPNATHT